MTIATEIQRKAFHLLILLVPTLYHFCGKWPSLLVISLLTFAVVGVDLARQKSAKINEIFSKIFGKIMREKELSGKHLCGASWFLLGASICILLFRVEFLITGFCILAISDALASLVGKSFPSREFFEKSRNGSLAFFLSALVILFTLGDFFHVRLWFYFFGIFAIFCLTMLEARPSLIGLDDNFVIPLGFCIIMTFFDLVWNYSY